MRRDAVRRRRADVAVRETGGEYVVDPTLQAGRQARSLRRAGAAVAIRISPASLFELTALHTLGRLRLSRPVEQWIDEALDAAGVRIAELSPSIAIDADCIPRKALADPLDRLLVATARRLDATFLTSDARILHYAAATRNVQVQDAGV
jgi:PIN domain nuclease of toxin-antitoxin system